MTRLFALSLVVVAMSCSGVADVPDGGAASGGGSGVMSGGAAGGTSGGASGGSVAGGVSGGVAGGTSGGSVAGGVSGGAAGGTSGGASGGSVAGGTSGGASGGSVAGGTSGGASGGSVAGGSVAGGSVAGGMGGGAAGGTSGGASGGSVAGGMSGGMAGGSSGGTSDGGIRGLDFPSNQGTGQPASGPGTYLRFVNPQLNGLPIWGPNGQGVTLVWKYFPRQQTGYYTTFFWANDGSFLWRSGGPDTYYGAHPYPTTSNNTGTSHNWEISVGGGDVITTRAGGPKLVVKGRWYTQALRVSRNANGTKTLIFYLDLPSTAPGDVIETTESASYGEVVPPTPALVFGNAPWRGAFQDERLSGVLRHVKIFDIALTEADTLAEAAATTLVTSQGQARIWYGKINPTPTDLTCDFGTGRAPQWADSGRAGLFTQ